MKTRIIHTKIWEDDYYLSLTDKERNFFLYLLTNSDVNLCGIYELPDSITRFKMNINNKALDDMKVKFSEDGKFQFYKGWVKIVNADKYNASYKNSPKTQKAYDKELQSIPLDVVQYFNKCSTSTLSIPYTYGIDTDRNHKTENINHKTENIIEENNNDGYIAFIQGFNEIVGSSYKGTKADREHFNARLRDGYTLGSLLSATRKASQDKYIMGDNDRHRRYLTPEYILRPNKLDEWLNQPESNEEERKEIFKDFIELINESANKRFLGSDIAQEQLFRALDKGYTFSQIGEVVQKASKDKWVRGENQSRTDLYTPEYLTKQTTLDKFLNMKGGVN